MKTGAGQRGGMTKNRERRLAGFWLEGAVWVLMPQLPPAAKGVRCWDAGRQPGLGVLTLHAPEAGHGASSVLPAPRIPPGRSRTRVRQYGHNRNEPKRSFPSLVW